MKRSLLSLPVVLLALTGCGSSSSSSSSSSATPSGVTASTGATASGGAAATGAGGSTVKVSIKDLSFRPGSLKVKVGTTVQWINEDTPPHNVTYVSGPKFASSPQVMNPGDKYSTTFTKPGTVSYYCSIHPFMKGTVVVSG